MTTDTLTTPNAIDTATGDHDTFAHYVKIHALIEGGEATALCGKKWIPRKDPKKYPVCPDCKRIFESLPEGPS